MALLPPLTVFFSSQRGKGAHESMKDLLGPTALNFDLTEIEGLDYLAYPEGVIKEVCDKEFPVCCPKFDSLELLCDHKKK